MTRPRIAFYGGSFDPPHLGHLAIGNALINRFDLDEFIFVPAFHAPHKNAEPTSAYDRYAMLCLATQNESRMSVSRLEIEMPERPYTVETMIRINKMLPRAKIFFVMGADSWLDITTWRDWKTLLQLNDTIVVTRPGYGTENDDVTDDVREQIVDLRGDPDAELKDDDPPKIFLTDAVELDISASSIRKRIQKDDASYADDLPVSVVKYIEKYQVYR